MLCGDHQLDCLKQIFQIISNIGVNVALSLSALILCDTLGVIRLGLCLSCIDYGLNLLVCDEGTL